MYADFDFYQTEYGGKVIESADDFKHYGRKAQRRMDVITGNKLRYAFPVEEYDADAVKQVFCELADFMCGLDRYQSAAIESAGIVTNADGTVQGKVVTSISSGSESVSYSAGGSSDSTIAAAAKDQKVADTIMYGMVYDGLSGVTDANGVYLLYAGIG